MDQPHSSGQQLYPTSSADCQPVQLTSEASSHPEQHVSSRRRLQSVSQSQTTLEDQQSSPVAFLPVASLDSILDPSLRFVDLLKFLIPLKDFFLIL